MRFTFTEKKVTVGDDVRQYAEKKISKLDRFFRLESDAYVTFGIERGFNLAEVTLNNNGMLYRVKESKNDYYSAIDSAVSAIERQIRKNKTRLSKRLREGAFDRTDEPVSGPADSEDVEEEERCDIVRVKRFSIKPMTPEEAILQMNLLGHEFFTFKNQNEDDVFSIVYKRKDGGYGLITSND